MKYLALILLFVASTASAQSLEYRPSLLPKDTSENIGTTSRPWAEGHFNRICLTADCKTAWPTGGGSSTGLGASTSTAPFMAGWFVATSTASASTFPYASTTALTVGNLNASGNNLNSSSGNITLNPFSGVVTLGTRIGTGDAGATLRLDSTSYLKFSSLVNNLNDGFDDVGLYRNAAGILEINSGTAGVYRDLILRNASTTLFSSTYASSTDQVIGRNLTFNGVTGATWASFCTTITGSSELCDGSDASGAGGSSAYEIATTSDIGVSQLSYFTKTGGRTTLASVATGTVSGTNGITVTAGRSAVGGALAIDCTVASGSQAGCLSTSDWTTFNSKESVLSFGAPMIRSGNTINWTGLATSTQPASSNLLVSNGGSNVYGVATSSATCTGSVSCSPFTVIGTAPTITSSALTSVDISANTNLAGTWPIILTGDTLSFGGLSTSTAPTLGHLPYWSGVNTFSSIATTSVTCSGNTTCTAFTAIGGAPITISSTGGGTSDEKWATSTQPTSGIYPNIATYVGIGTTTPRYLLQLASSTAPQLTLSVNGGSASNHWTFRNAAGSLYIATSSPTTFATSTTAALRVDTNGVVTFGTNNATCVALTGNASLCDGDDALGTGAFSFTPGFYNGQAINATSTGIWFKGTARSVIASTTFSTFASSTQLTNTGNTYFTGLSAGSLYLGSGSIVNNIATSSLTAGAGITFTGTAGALVGGTALTISTGTSTVDMMNATIIPDTSGNAWFEPYSVTATNDKFLHSVAIASSTTATSSFYMATRVPYNYGGTKAAVVMHFSCPVTTGNMTWVVQYRAIGGDDAESLDQTTYQQDTSYYTKACGSAANERQEVYFELTPSNIVANDTIEFKLSRDGTQSSDTGTSDAVIHDISFDYQ